MHATLRELIALRDGEPVDANAVAHVQGCDSCAGRVRELSQVRDALAALPAETPPPELWQRIAAARELETSRPQRARSGGRIAALLALAFVTAGVVLQLREPIEPETTARHVATEQLDELQRQSKNLESVLQQYRRPAVMSLSTAGAVNDIEDSIALIDYRLSEPSLDEAQLRSLWQQRVELMETLVTVRTAERLADSI